MISGKPGAFTPVGYSTKQDFSGIEVMIVQ